MSFDLFGEIIEDESLFSSFENCMEDLRERRILFKVENDWCLGKIIVTERDARASPVVHIMPDGTKWRVRPPDYAEGVHIHYRPVKIQE